MSMLRLRQENDSSYDGFLCPLCKGRCGRDEWTTEYGDPMAGDHEVTCPHCYEQFVVQVDIQVTYIPITP